MASALERAARAATREITRLRKVRVAEYPGSWKTSEGLGWENLDDVVAATTRAVLMAVRELPEEILNEHLHDNEYGYAMYYEGWQPAIDAILNEKDATND